MQALPSSHAVPLGLSAVPHVPLTQVACRHGFAGAGQSVAVVHWGAARHLPELGSHIPEQHCEFALQVPPACLQHVPVSELHAPEQHCSSELQVRPMLLQAQLPERQKREQHCESELQLFPLGLQQTFLVGLHEPEQHCPFRLQLFPIRRQSARACRAPRRDSAAPPALTARVLRKRRRDELDASAFVRSSNLWPSASLTPSCDNAQMVSPQSLGISDATDERARNHPISRI